MGEITRDIVEVAGNHIQYLKSKLAMCRLSGAIVTVAACMEATCQTTALYLPKLAEQDAKVERLRDAATDFLKATWRKDRDIGQYERALEQALEGNE